MQCKGHVPATSGEMPSSPGDPRRQRRSRVRGPRGTGRGPRPWRARGHWPGPPRGPPLRRFALPALPVHASTGAAWVPRAGPPPGVGRHCQWQGCRQPQTPPAVGQTLVERDPPPSLLLSAENPHYGFGDLGGPMRPRKPGFGTCPAPSLGTPQGRTGSQPVRTHMPRTRAGVYACALRVLALETLRACGRAGATANDVRIAAVGSKPFVETWQLRPSPAEAQRCAGCTQPVAAPSRRRCAHDQLPPRSAARRVGTAVPRAAPPVSAQCAPLRLCGTRRKRLRQLVQAGVCAADRSAFVATTHR